MFPNLVLCLIRFKKHLSNSRMCFQDIFPRTLHQKSLAWMSQQRPSFSGPSGTEVTWHSLHTGTELSLSKDIEIERERWKPTLKPSQIASSKVPRAVLQSIPSRNGRGKGEGGWHFTFIAIAIALQSRCVLSQSLDGLDLSGHNNLREIYYLFTIFVESLGHPRRRGG